MKSDAVMKDGIVPTDRGWIGPETTRAEFLRLYPDARIIVENDPWRSYSSGPVTVLGRAFWIGATFNGDVLDVVRLVASSETWPEANELERYKRENDEWLASNGIPAEHPLGAIKSVLDHKTWSAHITITYRNRNAP